MYYKKLLAILNEEDSATFCGATLSFTDDNGNLVCLNFGGRSFIATSNTEQIYIVPLEERYLLAKLYVKYKTPEHDYYASAKQLIDERGKYGSEDTTVGKQD